MYEKLESWMKRLGISFILGFGLGELISSYLSIPYKEYCELNDKRPSHSSYLPLQPSISPIKSGT